LTQKGVNSLRLPVSGLVLPWLQVLLAQRSFSVIAVSDNTTESRNIKPEVVSKVHIMAPYALLCLIVGPFMGEVPIFARLWPIRVKVGVSFVTGAVWSAILATAGLLVFKCHCCDHCTHWILPAALLTVKATVFKLL